MLKQKTLTLSQISTKRNIKFKKTDLFQSFFVLFTQNSTTISLEIQCFILYSDRMSDFLIKKRLGQLCKEGSIEEVDMINLFKEYEQDKLNNVAKEDSTARTILILGNMSLVHHVLKHKFNIEYYDESRDEISIGKLGLIRAVDTFRLDNNIKFSTYAVRVIINEMLVYYKKINTLSNMSNKNAISLEECVNAEVDEHGQLHLVDFLGEEDEGIKSIAEKDCVDRIIKTMKYLNNREQIVMLYSFGLFGYPRLKQHEIATQMGVSRGYVSGLYITGLKKLKLFALNEEELSAEQTKQKERIIKHQRDSGNQICEIGNENWCPKW